MGVDSGQEFSPCCASRMKTEGESWHQSGWHDGALGARAAALAVGTRRVRAETCEAICSERVDRRSIRMQRKKCAVSSVPTRTPTVRLYLKLPVMLSVGCCYFHYSNFGVVGIVLRAGVGGGGICGWGWDLWVVATLVKVSNAARLSPYAVNVISCKLHY